MPGERASSARPPRGAVAHRRPRLRQRLPDLRGARLAARAAAGPARRRRRQGAVAPAQHRGRRGARLADESPSSPPASSTSLEEPPDVVLALHACDTATDDALARAVGWEAALVLAAPCCHHDISAQLREAPGAIQALTRRHLRERFADTLTDALRAASAGATASTSSSSSTRSHAAQHLAARRTHRGGVARGREEYDELVATWPVRPQLAELLTGRSREGAPARRRWSPVGQISSCVVPALPTTRGQFRSATRRSSSRAGSWTSVGVIVTANDSGDLVGVHGRPGDRARRSGSPSLAGRRHSTSRPSRRPAAVGCGSATSGTTRRSASRSASSGSRCVSGRSTVTPDVYRLVYPTAP